MKIFHRRFVAELNANIAFDGTKMGKRMKKSATKDGYSDVICYIPE